jgi:RsmE family RNA methyltransferase
VEPGELQGEYVTVGGRRALHLRGILGATIGSRVRAGVIGGGIGTAEVVADDGTNFALRLAVGDQRVEPHPVEVVLAVPRPKVLTRSIEVIASFGVERITLTNAWRVDKSYLSSPRLEDDALDLARRLGAEQGVTTHLPPITLHRRLMEMLDTRWPAGNNDNAIKLLAHPAGMKIESTIRTAAPITLAIGPEGGWIERELDTFVERGFTPVSLGAPILRVEAAVAAALGQIILLRRLAMR